MKFEDWKRTFNVKYNRPDLDEIRESCKCRSTTIVTNGFTDSFIICNDCYVVKEYGMEDPKEIDKDYK